MHGVFSLFSITLSLNRTICLTIRRQTSDSKPLFSIIPLSPVYHLTKLLKELHAFCQSIRLKIKLMVTKSAQHGGVYDSSYIPLFKPPTSGYNRLDHPGVPLLLCLLSSFRVVCFVEIVYKFVVNICKYGVKNL